MKNLPLLKDASVAKSIAANLHDMKRTSPMLDMSSWKFPVMSAGSGAIMGGGIGAATGDEGDRMDNALRGAGIGAVGGAALGTGMMFGAKKLMHDNPISALKKDVPIAKKNLPSLAEEPIVKTDPEVKIENPAPNQETREQLEARLNAEATSRNNARMAQQKIDNKAKSEGKITNQTDAKLNSTIPISSNPVVNNTIRENLGITNMASENKDGGSIDTPENSWYIQDGSYTGSPYEKTAGKLTWLAGVPLATGALGATGAALASDPENRAHNALMGGAIGGAAGLAGGSIIGSNIGKWTRGRGKSLISELQRHVDNANTSIEKGIKEPFEMLGVDGINHVDPAAYQIPLDNYVPQHSAGLDNWASIGEIDRYLRGLKQTKKDSVVRLSDAKGEMISKGRDDTVLSNADTLATYINDRNSQVGLENKRKNINAYVASLRDMMDGLGGNMNNSSRAALNNAVNRYNAAIHGVGGGITPKDVSMLNPQTIIPSRVREYLEGRAMTGTPISGKDISGYNDLLGRLANQESGRLDVDPRELAGVINGSIREYADTQKYPWWSLGMKKNKEIKDLNSRINIQ